MGQESRGTPIVTVFGVVDRALTRRLPAVPPADPYASILPTPIDDDDFFTAPENLDGFSPGHVLSSRTIRGRVPRPLTLLRQFMVRSTDALGRPVAVTASLLVPKRPWTGRGPRPLLAHNVAIDSLGLKATPSYRMIHGFGQDNPPIVPVWLARGYAVLVTDHQGPRMAYSEGTMAGHAILDAIRGVKSLDPSLADSPVVAYGYSGGAIATVWTAQLQPSYAPEIELAGAIAGGTPTDFSLLLTTMNGKVGAGLLGAATIGLAREHPGMVDLFGPKALMVASWAKDMSVVPLALGGLARLRLETLSGIPDVFDSEVSRRVMELNNPGATAPSAPVAFYHGSKSKLLGDQWIPEAGVLALTQRWRALGADVEYRPVPGDHLIGAITGLPFVVKWAADRFAD